MAFGGVASERLALLVDAKTGGAVREFDKLSKKIKEVDAPTSALDRRLASLAKTTGVSAGTLKAGLAVGATFAGEALVKFGVQSVQAASNLNEQITATRTLFGEASDEVERFAGTASQLGMSKRAALEAANGFASLFTNIGLTDDRAAALSTGMVRLAGDLASFKNISADEALTRLRSGLVGEAEPLRRLGILVNENSVKQRAFALGLGATGRELSDSEKILARYSLILEQTKDAQGDAERTGNSLANQLRRLSAEYENLQASFGEGGMDPAAKLAGGLADLARLAQQLHIPDAIKGIDTLIPEIPDTGAIKRIMSRDDLSFFDKVHGTLGEVFGGFLKTKHGAEDASAATAVYTQIAKESGLAVEEVKRQMESGALASQVLAKAHAENAEKARALRDAMQGTVSAHRGLEAAYRAITTAGERVGDARERLDELLAKTAVDAKELEQATRSLTNAQRSVADAEERHAEALKHLNEVMKGSDPGDLEDAALSVRGAELAVTRALQQQARAYKALNTARGREDRASAALDAREAELGVEQAKRALIEAQERQNELQGYGKEGSEELADAQRDLRDAELAVADSKVAERDAAIELAAAQAGDPDFARKVRDAKNELRDAEWNLAGAKDGVTAAILNVQDAQQRELELFGAAGAAAGILRKELEGLARTYPEVAGLLDRLMNFQGTQNAALAVLGGLGAAFSGAPIALSGGRATGGPVIAGQSYRVGENGPETLHMGSHNGYVSANGGGGSTNVYITMPPGSDGEDVVNAIRRYEARNGSRWRNN